ncbi:MAG: YdcF family protein [Actinomycetia bacterium]|nr:YdcF family protein [Actinomycetes bacterium]
MDDDSGLLGTAGLSPRRLMVRFAALLGAFAVVYLVVTFGQVWLASRADDARPSQAIIVMGAAQYDGEPSPVLRARLDQAAGLYRDGFAPIVVVTGGGQASDRTTEAKTGYDYLRDLGVPDDRLRLEVQGTTTWESLAATRRFLVGEGITDVILVSDPYHSLRLRGMADELGLNAVMSPAATPTPLRSLVRETAAVSAGRVLGYGRLDRWLN